MSINLKVEEYCQNCPDFEPVVQKDCERMLVTHHIVDPLNFAEPEVKHICETTVECKYKKRCAAQMRYLQKQHDAMKKKETGECVK